MVQATIGTYTQVDITPPNFPSEHFFILITSIFTSPYNSSLTSEPNKQVSIPIHFPISPTTSRQVFSPHPIKMHFSSLFIVLALSFLTNAAPFPANNDIALTRGDRAGSLDTYNQGSASATETSHDLEKRKGSFSFGKGGSKESGKSESTKSESGSGGSWWNSKKDKDKGKDKGAETQTAGQDGKGNKKSWKFWEKNKEQQKDETKETKEAEKGKGEKDLKSEQKNKGEQGEHGGKGTQGGPGGQEVQEKQVSEGPGATNTGSGGLQTLGNSVGEGIATHKANTAQSQGGAAEEGPDASNPETESEGSAPTTEYE